MRALAVTAASMRRMTRDRTALFFTVLLPVLMIVIIGAIVQSPGGFRLGVLEPSGAEAVALVDGRAALEASGRLTLANAKAYADTGVDYLAVGALTHSSPILDIGLDLRSEGSERD